MYCNSSKTGVYAIICLENGFWYIGSAKSVRGFWSRIFKHRNDLQRGVHHSPILQKHYERYGEDAFTVLILEECEPDKCIEVEQIWLDLNGVGSENCSYNLLKIAGGVPSNLGKKLTEVAKRKISERAKRRKLSPENIAKITAARLAVKSLDYVVTSPNNEEIEIKNLRAFCREHNLCPSAMGLCAKGKQTHCKGWKCRYASTTIEEQEAAIAKVLNNRRKIYIAISPTGEEYVTESLNKFCFEHKLTATLMRHVANGDRFSHNGWKCRLVDEPDLISQKRRLSVPRGVPSRKSYIITLPSGEEVTITGLAEFCRTHNLQRTNMCDAATSGKTYNGYKCRRID
ncbi:MAG: GIY-YIG nuclease family protein [Xenococcaceae cyanobacterium]